MTTSTHQCSTSRDTDAFRPLARPLTFALSVLMPLRIALTIVLPAIETVTVTTDLSTYNRPR